MLKTFKYRCYPTKAQVTLLEKHLNLCRIVYNKTLEVRKDAWENGKTHISLYDTCKMLPIWKEIYPDLKQVHSQVLQNAQLRVDLAFITFFRKVKAGGERVGYPRFKGPGRYDSLTYPQWMNGFRIENNKLRLPKIGNLKLIIHRPIEGKIKTVTIRKVPTGKWFVSFFCEGVEPVHIPAKGNAVGIDVGLTTFATLSNGKKIENPRFFKSEEKALAKAQRKFSKCEKGTPERKRTKKVVSRIHERITNKRSNFVFQEVNKLIKQYGIISVENLKIQKMMQGSSLAKGIADVAWGQFFNQLSFKAEYAGGIVIKVDPKNTSQQCSRCGILVQKDLSVRVHSCPVCGLKIGRDLNAAINILALGLQSMESPPKSSHL